MKLPLILLGAGGHAKVLLALAKSAGLVVQGLCDPMLAQQGQSDWNGLPVLGGDEALDGIDPRKVGLINGLGQLVGQRFRNRLFENLKAKGFTFPVLVHPTAWVAPTARLEQGVQIMAGSIVQPDCNIGENTIINTRASVDHDCWIGKNVHIAPGATLCGGVIIGDDAFIGSGATIIQGLRIGARAVAGAGVTLVRDLPSDARALGLLPQTDLAPTQDQPD
jgi:UDP-perosamine 4-acetyltransferase